MKQIVLILLLCLAFEYLFFQYMYYKRYSGVFTKNVQFAEKKHVLWFNKDRIILDGEFSDISVIEEEDVNSI